MVTPTGLEPVASGLGISRSILMSYGAKLLNTISQTILKTNIVIYFIAAKS